MRPKHLTCEKFQIQKEFQNNLETVGFSRILSEQKTTSIIDGIHRIPGLVTNLLKLNPLLLGLLVQKDMYKK